MAITCRYFAIIYNYFSVRICGRKTRFPSGEALQTTRIENLICYLFVPKYKKMFQERMSKLEKYIPTR